MTARILIVEDEQPIRMAVADALRSEGFEVLEAADMVGSTSGMIKYLADERPEKVVMITECSMSDNVSVEYPDIDFVRSCTLCPHMKKITLERVAASLKFRQFSVEIAPEVAARALRAVERMIEVGRGERG